MQTARRSDVITFQLMDFSIMVVGVYFVGLFDIHNEFGAFSAISSY